MATGTVYDLAPTGPIYMDATGANPPHDRRMPCLWGGIQVVII